jgi:hypothetical protein
MKAVFLSLLLVFTLGVVNAEASPTLDEQKTELLSDITGTTSSQHECDERPPRRPDPVTCVSNCTYRYANGMCGTYGPDHCAPNARCVENCTYRYANGMCGTYGPDSCN